MHLRYRKLFIALLFCLSLQCSLNAQTEYNQIKTDYPWLTLLDSVFKADDFLNAESLVRVNFSSNSIAVNAYTKAFVYNKMIFISRKLYKHDTARLYLDSATVALSQIPKNDLDLIWADYYFVKGDLMDRLEEDAERSLSAYQKSLDIQLELLGPFNHEVRNSYKAIADVYLWLKQDMITAQDYYHKALDVADILTLNDTQRKASICYDLASAYRKQSDIQNAELYALRAFNIFQKFPDTPDDVLSNVNNLLSNVYYDMEQYDRGKHFIKKTFQINLGLNTPKSMKNLVFANTTLGSIFFNEREIDSAKYYFERAYELQLSISEEPSVELSNCLSNLGSLAMWKNDFPAAENYFSSCLSMRRSSKKYGEKHRATGDAFRFLAELYVKMEETERALEFYHAALKAQIGSYEDNDHLSIPSFDDVPTELYVFLNIRGKADILKSIAISLKSEAHIDMALAYYDLLIKLLKRNSVLFEEEKSKLDVSKSYAQVYLSALDALLIKSEYSGEPLDYDHVWSILNDGRAQVLVEYLSNDRLNQAQSSFLELRVTASVINLELDELVEELASHQGSSDTDLIEKRMSQLLLKKDTLIRGLRTEQYGQYTFESLDLSTIKKRSKEQDRGFLQFLIDNEKGFIYTFALFQNEVEFSKTSLKKVDSLKNELIEELIIHSVYLPSFIQFQNSSNSLYQVLMPEAIKKNIKSIKRLSIVTDGDLNDFPFEALLVTRGQSAVVDFSNLDYLVNHVDIDYPSSFQLDSEIELKLNNPSVFGYAYDSRRTSGMEDNSITEAEIPGTAIEVSYLESLFEGDYSYGEGLSELTLDSLMAAHNILHFATHGSVDYNDPTQSYLSFRVNDGTVDKDFLKAYEIPKIDLTGKLVMLSACETNLGKLLEGEGVSSMSRNFLLAGAVSVISTLWRVDDERSAGLVKNFYSYFSQGYTAERALTQGKRDYIKNAGSYNSHPYYWAGYKTLQHQQVRLARFKYVNLLIGGLVLMLIFLILKLYGFRMRGFKRLLH